MIKKFFIFHWLLASFFLLPGLIHAQFNFGSLNVGSSFSLSNELNVDITPSNPKPNSTVRVNLAMYTENLDSATITWYVNGQKMLSGIGEKSLALTVGKAGSETGVEINVTLANGVSFSKSLVLRPASIDLLWQSNSYTPPFYRGKALYPRQGSVLVAAEPEFYIGNSRIDPARLNYKWSVNNSVIQNQSGYGRQNIVVQGPALGTSLNISVTVTDNAGGLSASESMVVNPVDPKIVFYENSPLYGIIFDRAVNGGLVMNNDEVSIVASPFYSEIGENTTFSWKMNGRVVAGVSGLSATFRKPEGSGSALLSFQIQDLRKVLQRSEGGFNIIYGNE